MVEVHDSTTLVIYEVNVPSSPSIFLALPRGIFEELGRDPEDPRRAQLVEIVIETIPAEGVKKRHARSPYSFPDLSWFLTMIRLRPEDVNVLDTI